MPGQSNKKRPIEGRLQRPSKKQKRQALKQYHSESEAEEDQSFDPVNLLDSDDDIHNAKVDDGADDGDSDSSSEEEEQQQQQPKPEKRKRERTSSKVTSRRRSTLSPWELETLMAGTAQ